MVFITTVYYILQQRARTRLWWLFYVVVLFMVSTIYTICAIYADDLVWIDQRNIPGGPLTWFFEKENTTPDIVGQSMAIICGAMTTALLVRPLVNQVLCLVPDKVEGNVALPVFCGVELQMVNHCPPCVAIFGIHKYVHEARHYSQLMSLPYSYRRSFQCTDG